MSRPIAAHLQAEPGWIAVCADESKPDGISIHCVCGWALVGLPSPDGVLTTALPTTLAGTIISERPGYLGLISPSDDRESKLTAFRKAVCSPCTVSCEAESCAVA